MPAPIASLPSTTAVKWHGQTERREFASSRIAWTNLNTAPQHMARRR
ncbi:hypothetical protein NOGI109294_20310 [Nocardiopsis gilva]